MVRRMNVSQLEGWTPIRVYWGPSGPMVDWCYLGNTRFTDPFFDQTVERCLRRPFNLLFRHQTSIEVLGERWALQPAWTPAGFIFHMSRCGSTLISQLLASLSNSMVISEASVVDTVLHANFRHPDISDDQRITWLRWLFSALGQSRSAPETSCFIKFDSLHTLHLPLIQRAFPGVPWIFVYREPVEVMVSNLRETAARLVQGVVAANPLNLEITTRMSISREEYHARVLAEICKCALQHRHNDTRLVNYRDLPAVVWSSLLGFWSIDYTTDELDNMRYLSQFDAKTPSTRFESDTAIKQRDATDLVWQITEQWLRPLYDQLEAVRKAQEKSVSGAQ
jgi:hypothetical protein